jgi:hypothetical protein
VPAGLRCFERAEAGAEWQKTVSRVRADHHRKSRHRHPLYHPPGRDPTALTVM